MPVQPGAKPSFNWYMLHLSLPDRRGMFQWVCYYNQIHRHNQLRRAACYHWQTGIAIVTGFGFLAFHCTASRFSSGTSCAMVLRMAAPVRDGASEDASPVKICLNIYVAVYVYLQSTSSRLVAAIMDCSLQSRCTYAGAYMYHNRNQPVQSSLSLFGSPNRSRPF